MLGASLVESIDGCLPSCLRPRRDNERLIVPQSVGKLANAWNTCLFRMIVYTKLALPVFFFKTQLTRQLLTVNLSRITIKLVLNDVVENFQKKKHQVMIVRSGKQEPRRAERLQKMEQLRAGHHGQRLQIRGYCRKRK